MRRVVVTGIGVVSALGNTAADFWQALSEGRSGIAPISKVDVSTMRFQNAAEVKNFNPNEHFDEKALLWLDPFALYGIVAAREAVADSGIEFNDDLKENSGVITGNCLGGKMTEDELFYKLYAEGKQRHQPVISKGFAQRIENAAQRIRR